MGCIMNRQLQCSLTIRYPKNNPCSPLAFRCIPEPHQQARSVADSIDDLLCHVISLGEKEGSFDLQLLDTLLAPFTSTPNTLQT